MTTPTATTIHPDFNFRNGDIVLAVIGSLAASDPEEIIYLKVHQCFLRTHSTVFDKMLELPVLSSSDPSGEGVPGVIDGIPVVQLHDEPEDMLNLLKVIYFSGSVPYKPLMQETFDFIASVVKLADKYDMSMISKSLIPRVEADWPTTLKKWDAIEGQTAAMRDVVEEMRRVECSELALDELLVEPASVIRFGRTYGASNILPAAFYHLSRLSFTFDKNMSCDTDDKFDYIHNGGRTARRRVLHAEDLEALYEGQGAIKMWLHNAADGAYSDWPERCLERMSKETAVKCKNYKWWTKSVRPELLRILIHREIDVLAHLREMIDDLPSGGCLACSIFARKYLEGLRVEFWTALPELFGVPPFKLGPGGTEECPF